MEIIRRDELQELLDVVRMNPYGKFLITGVAGSGKTFLLNIIGKILEEQGIDILYKSVAFSNTSSKIWNTSPDLEDIVCLVDGLDEIYRYKQIVEHIKNGRGCYICTARENKFDINPKVDGDKNIGCDYCKFRDICFVKKKNKVAIVATEFGGEDRNGLDE